jgi:inosose dehydratase
LAAQVSRMMIGIQPTGWTNDDFPEIGNDIPYQVILDETKRADFEGGSTGHNYPTHLPSLLYSLSHRKITIVSTWFGTAFTTGLDFTAGITAFEQQISFLKAVNAKDVVVAELANAVNQVRSKSVLTDRPIFNAAEWYLLTSSLDIAGKIAHDNGMQLSYHPHVGTGVMTIEETERLISSTDSEYVGICLDTAHLRFGGATQAEIERLTNTHIKRIKHVHLKNVRTRILPLATDNNYSFYQAIQAGIFTVPGDLDGDLNLDPIVDALVSVGYDRWLVVEAEQNPLHATLRTSTLQTNPVQASPFDCAQTARAYIKSRLGY